MATRRRRNTRSRRGRQSQPTPGWVWMLFGLAVGLAIAIAIHLKHRDAPTPATPQPAATVVDEPPSEVITPQPTEPAGRRFDFYELLPQFEVVVPETDGPARPDRTPEAVETPGRYVLQAGSFSRYEDADRMKASLALQGIESEIQRVQIDRDTFHRVRIGPFDDLERLNRVRDRLREAQVEVLLIRMPD